MIGDSQAVVLSRELEPKLLLSPFNLLKNRDLTIFANSSNAANFMKIEQGSAADIAGFVLITDGADKLFERSHAETELIQLSSICALSQQHAQAALEKVVSDLIVPNTNDDVTVLMAMRIDADICRIAQATCNVDLTSEVSDRQEYDVGEEIPAVETEGSAESTDDPPVRQSLIGFLTEAPRTAEELVAAGYCSQYEVLAYLFPLLAEGYAQYSDYRFSAVKGG